MSTPSKKARVLKAAFKRIDSVPVGRTFIDRLSDEDWLSDDVSTWDITVGACNSDALNKEGD